MIGERCFLAEREERLQLTTFNQGCQVTKNKRTNLALSSYKKDKITIRKTSRISKIMAVAQFFL